MLQQLGKLAVSLIVTNWIYAEAVLLFPQVDPLCRKVVHVARIPTHNEWPKIMRSPRAAALGRDMDNYLEQSSLRNAFAAVGVLDQRARAAAKSGLQSLRGNAPAPAETASPMLSDDAIFNTVHSANAPIGYVPFGYDV